MRPPAAVTIDGQPAQRQGEWFRGEFDAPNQSAAVYPTNTVQVVQGGVTNTASVTTFVPPDTLAYQHDADGNLTRDARWDYKWDAENRLLRVSTRADLPPEVPRVTTAFTYDAAGRRIRKLVTDAAGATVSELRYLWHQNHLLMEVNGQNLALRPYQWGPDISGTFDGAAGAGGLYNINGVSSDNGPLWSDYANILPAHDGRGNIIGLGDRNYGSLWAQFEYDSYGRTVSEKFYPGASAHVPKIPFRYNTRLTDRETGHIYYRFRHYSPALGRWLNRDPIGEAGGLNLFGMVGNDPVNRIDPLGLWDGGIMEEFLGQYGDEGLRLLQYHVMLSQKKDLGLGIAAHDFWFFDSDNKDGLIRIETDLDNAAAARKLKRELDSAYDKAIGKFMRGCTYIMGARTFCEVEKYGCTEFTSGTEMLAEASELGSQLQSSIEDEIKWSVALGITATTAKAAIDLIRAKRLAKAIERQRGLIHRYSLPNGTSIPKGTSVIGPRATYRQFAKERGFRFLDVKDEYWSEAKNLEYLQGIVERGDDVAFAGKFDPALFNKNSPLGVEIQFLLDAGYKWVDDFTRLVKD